MNLCSSTESNQVAIITSTFTGAMLPIKREEIWRISFTKRYFSITFTDIDIICNQGSSLQVSFDGETRTFCNLHRPIDAIIPRGDGLSIRFYTGQIQGTLRQDGFKATYNIMKHKGYIEDMMFEIKGIQIKPYPFQHNENLPM